MVRVYENISYHKEGDSQSSSIFSKTKCRKQGLRMNHPVS